MKKKIVLGIAAAGTALAMLPLFAAFEAHVINVTARIENALAVSTNSIDFGTVFPQEHLNKPLSIRLSSSFMTEPRVDDVEYFIRQKPKCGITKDNGTVLVGPTATGHISLGTVDEVIIDCGPAPRTLVLDDPATQQVNEAETWGVLPSLCEYISKEDDKTPDNDGSTTSFHQPWTIDNHQIVWNDTLGRLAKSENDIDDNWTIDLAVPCFGGHCAQDWLSFVRRITGNPNLTQADADAYTQPIANEHKVFGCDLWVEVSGVSVTPTPTPTPIPIVGALVASYNDPDPTSCTSTVRDAVSGSITHTSIQAAINAASDGNTVCVDPTYVGGDTFPVNVDKDLTIAGLGAMGDANIPGGFFISDSGVTITGLEFTNYSFIQASENAAIYIHNEIGVSGVALANTTIDHNIFTAPGGAKAALAKGVVTEIGSGAAVQATGIDILHNVFNGWRQAMFFNTADDYEVAFNDILNNDVGVANDGPDNASIHNNDFESNVLEAVGVAPSATNGTGNNGLLTVNTNNFAPAGAGNNVNWYGASVQGGEDVNAENNWWDGEADAARTNDTVEVDTNPFSAVAFPEN